MVYQWKIFLADPNGVEENRQAFQSPVLVISEEVVNQALPVVTVLYLAALKPNRKVYPVEVLLEPEISHLSHRVITMAYQINSIPKNCLSEQCGYIDDDDLKDEIRSIIRLYLDL